MGARQGAYKTYYHISLLKTMFKDNGRQRVLAVSGYTVAKSVWNYQYLLFKLKIYPAFTRPSINKSHLGLSYIVLVKLKVKVITIVTANPFCVVHNCMDPCCQLGFCNVKHDNYTDNEGRMLRHMGAILRVH
jgi:hypothetical protein